jgi:hypothetical protein
MTSAGKQNFERDEAFVGEHILFSKEVLTKPSSQSKASLLKRRLIDDILQEKRLQDHLKDYDFNLDDD